MAWEHYKPTAAEKHAILDGLYIVEKYARDGFTLNQHVRQEAKGCGFPSDRIPRIAVQGLITKWFRDGVGEPDMQARHIWRIRPAAIWATGTGIEASGKITPEERATLDAAVSAHEAAFTRHMETLRCS